MFAIGGHLSSLDIDVEDTASTLMECEFDGRSLPVHLHQDYLQRPASRICEVVGENAKATIDFTRHTLEVVGPDGRLPDSFIAQGFERNDLFLDEMKHFVECVRGEAEPIVTVAEAALSLRVALAARESIDTGKVVTL